MHQLLTGMFIKGQRLARLLKIESPGKELSTKLGRAYNSRCIVNSQR